jgi:hypothetical protein
MQQVFNGSLPASPPFSVTNNSDKLQNVADVPGVRPPKDFLFRFIQIIVSNLH